MTNFILRPFQFPLTTDACAVLSARNCEVRVAQPPGGVLVMPVVLVFVASIVILELDTEVVLSISGRVAPCVASLYFLSLQTFRRVRILPEERSSVCRRRGENPILRRRASHSSPGVVLLPVRDEHRHLTLVVSIARPEQGLELPLFERDEEDRIPDGENAPPEEEG